jgi:hypothetical protein
MTQRGTRIVPKQSTDRERSIGSREIWTFLLLLFGGFFAGIGWFAGAWMLWWSEVWTRREKLLGTLVLPGGLAASAVGIQQLIAINGSQSALVDAAVLVAAFLAVLAPVAAMLFLARRAVAHASSGV